MVLLKREATRPQADPAIRSLFGLASARSDRSFYGFYRGLKWCAEAQKESPDDPYLLVNLGKVYLYHGLREKALDHLNRAMEFAPQEPFVQEARHILGFRQRPKIPFLARSNPLNVLLGRLAVSIKKLFLRRAKA